MLSITQLKVVDLIFNKKKNVFFTGSAGTGKSLLLRYIINEIRNVSKSLSLDPKIRFQLPFSSNQPDILAVTASTGIAAFNIGGQTIHSFAGIGLGQADVKFLLEKIHKNKFCWNNWVALKYLIIDEVSMLDGDLFDKLDLIAKDLRNNQLPFGGIQLIVAGDFFQLPPVSRGGDVKFCFDAKSWSSCIKETIVLDQIFRQKDPAFSTILNEARLGELSDKAIKTFKSLERPLISNKDGVQATELYSTRQEVDLANLKRLNTLPHKSMFFISRDYGKIEPIVNSMDNYSMYQNQLELKLYSQVMLIKNMNFTSHTLVNGSLGIVIGFEPPPLPPTTTNNNNNNNSESNKKRKEDQGFNKYFGKNGNGLVNSEGLYPLVRFTCGYEMVITPEESHYQINNQILATRKQVPLLLAWALSIHKAQGQTLELVKVDLNKVFEKGQAYVALSRATTLNGLQVLNFKPEKVQAHQKVLKFYYDIQKKNYN